jgi:hypothetical protein
MKNVLFFVHGIGRHAAGWSGAPDGPIAALENAMKLYPECFRAGNKLSDYLELVEIRYDDVFDLILNQWQSLADKLGAAGGNINWVGEVQGLLTRVGGHQNQFVDFGGDVALYCGFRLVARIVRLRINSIIAAEILRVHLKARDAGGLQVPRFGVIAHSLGTAVAQDALLQLATQPWTSDEDAIQAELPGHPELIDNPHHSEAQRAHREHAADGTRAFPDRPIPVGLTLLCQLSNTTRVCTRASGEYATLRKAGGRLSPLDCELFINVNNKLDPVSRVCAYRMPDRPNALDVVLDHLHQPNVHGFGHYLSHPAVHGPVFRSLVADFSFACAQRAQTLAGSSEWHGIGGELGAMAKARQDEVEAKLKALLRDGGDVGNLRAVVLAMTRDLGVKL